MDLREHSPTGSGEAGELEQRLIAARELPAPETTEEWQDLPSYPPAIAVPKHIEDITVVASTYRPPRLLTGGGVELSATGGGLNFNATVSHSHRPFYETFLRPATQKTLAPQHLDRERSMAVSPFSTRKDGFGVISIFIRPDKTLYIENDEVSLGATAYFVNRRNLTIEKYQQNKAELD
ncbi:hypothetical protein EDB81DRAFT_755592 [Dactylonectria macrodidyma]|uniref:Uncharacterized protein n=1 Tax=Dactylonectria macrodidyma TaxID=307937 RepID=A0A9P9FH53_9HYPO|nr:hypothetical protein EDB81DRAFT_755592 [Dactylonectria macrodidyma]